MPNTAHKTHYVCTGGCGGVTDKPNATCQAEGCPLHKHPLVPCSCKDGKHTEVLKKRSEELRELEETLNKERDRVNLIISSMGEGLLVVDTDRKITMINPAAETLLEISHKDAIGKDWSQIVSTLKGSKKTPTNERSFARTLVEGKAIITHLDDDHYYLTKSGRKYPIVSITAPLKGATGEEVIGAVKVFRDATPEKKSKKIVEQRVEDRTRELGEEQARLLASLENLPLGFFIIDLSHNIVVINPAMQEILGLTNRKWTFEVMEKVFAESGIDFDQLCAHCRGVISSYGIDDVSFGNKILRVISVPIIMPDEQEIIGTAVVVEDVTEAKLLERAKDEFFSIASHELRTPLAAIRGNAAMLQEYFGDKLEDADMREMIEDMRASSVRLIKIVNDFLDVSRLEQRRVEFKKESLDLVLLIKEFLKDLEGTADERGLYLKFVEPKVEIPRATGDRDRVREVVINLVGNAIKFTDKGGATVETKKRGDFIKVFINDTGTGIPKDNQKLLFRKFQQAGEKILTRDVTQGTGLGLYISKLLIEGMGGKIALEKTEEGEGSTFSFSLPIAKEKRKE